MNLFELLKQFKAIEPDSTYTAISKRALLAQQPMAATPVTVRSYFGAQRTFLRIIETGAAVALTGFFVLLLTGALSGSKIVPQYAAVDTGALRAEAEAIDIQIQLANLNYASPAAESTMQIAGVAPALSTSVKKDAAASVATGAGDETAPVVLSIDEALKGLTE